MIYGVINFPKQPFECCKNSVLPNAALIYMFYTGSGVYVCGVAAHI